MNVLESRPTCISVFKQEVFPNRNQHPPLVLFSPVSGHELSAPRKHGTSDITCRDAITLIRLERAAREDRPVFLPAVTHTLIMRSLYSPNVSFFSPHDEDVQLRAPIKGH